MPIKLTRPSGTEVYDIGVFNSNSEIIETAINKILEDNETISEKTNSIFNYYLLTSDDNIDIKLNDGIYYFSNSSPSGTLPNNLASTMNAILLCSNYNNESSMQFLFTNSGIYYRTINNTVGSWINTDISVVDSLNSDATNSALSANQGKILNNTKLSINVAIDINVDDCEQGVYICLPTTEVTGTLPSEIVVGGPGQKFILESYGGKGNLVYQKMIVYQSNSIYYRTGGAIQDSFSFSNWTKENINEIIWDVYG